MTACRSCLSTAPSLTVSSSTVPSWSTTSPVRSTPASTSWPSSSRAEADRSCGVRTVDGLRTSCPLAVGCRHSVSGPDLMLASMLAWTTHAGSCPQPSSPPGLLAGWLVPAPAPAGRTPNRCPRPACPRSDDLLRTARDDRRGILGTSRSTALQRPLFRRPEE